MAGKISKLALLTAGLFLSLKSYAAGECLAYAGSIVDFISFPAGTSCPAITAKTVSGVECELVTVSDGTFVCAKFEDGSQTIGGPWRYTGGVFGGETGTDPSDPPDPPVSGDFSDIRQPRQYTGADAANFSNAQYYSENSLLAASGILFRNQNSIAGDLVQRLNKHDQEVKASEAATRSAVGSLAANFSTSLTDLQNSNEALHKKTHDTQEEEKLALEEIKNSISSTSGIIQYNKGMIDNIWNAIGTSGPGSGCGGFDCPPSYSLAQILQINQQQLLDSLSSGGGSGDSEQTQLLSSIEANTYDSYRKLRDVEELLESIDEKTGTGGSGGSDSDMTATNQKLDTINSTLQSNQLAMSSQLGQQLSEIKSAIEDGSGGGSGGDNSGTNDRLDAIIQNTAITTDKVDEATAAINGLGKKLDGIGEGIEGISDALKDGTGQKNGPSTCEGKDCWKAASWVKSSYPDGVAGLWETRKEAFDRSGMNQYLKSLVPNIGGNGGLKPFELCFDMGFAHYGCHSFTIPPYVIAFIRICLLISAGFYCQRLVFGGA